MHADVLASARTTFPAVPGASRSLGRLDPLVDVSVIIVSWNTRALLHACLTSLADASDSVRAEIIVVDNASRDGSARMVEHGFPHVRLIANSRNEGFAAANNRGAGQAHGRYLLLLNSDTVVPPDTIDPMVAYMDAHSGVGALGPRLLNADRSLQRSARDFPHPATDAIAILEMERWSLAGALARRYQQRTSAYWSDHQRTREVDWITGACLLLRREALEGVGLLDEGYFFFGEEMDLCYRLRQRGWTIVFLAAGDVVHLGGQSASQVPAARLVWHYRGLQRFYRLHRSTGQQAALRLVIAATALARIAWLLARYGRSGEVRPIVSSYAQVLKRAIT